jgi:Cu(I)/Ag(I) efflux system membrane fusion protein
MEGAPESGNSARRVHQGTGEVVLLGERELIIKHGEIPSVGMGAMTMPFDAPKSVIPPGLKKGDRIRFEFTMQSDGQMQITSIARADASAPDHGAHK